MTVPTAPSEKSTSSTSGPTSGIESGEDSKFSSLSDKVKTPNSDVFGDEEGHQVKENVSPEFGQIMFNFIFFIDTL